MTERVIHSDACVAEGAAWLAANDPDFALIMPRIAPLPLRLRDDGFSELLSAIVSQQVSVASARAIWTRIKDAGLITPNAVLAADDDALKALGLSRPKMRYARALAAADLNYASLRDMPTPDVIKTLTAVPGIGVWTAEIYAKFSLGRADVFAAGDLALQEAARHLLHLSNRPSEKEMRALAAKWAPWRSVAARALWTYYAQIKSRDGIT